MSNEKDSVLMAYVKQMSFLVSMLLVVMMVLNILVAFFSSFGTQQSIDEEAVNNRLKAIEVVAVKGEEKATTTATAEVVSEALAEDVAVNGEAIYTATCFACHGTGILESPKKGDKEAWNKRLEANADIDGLVQSAIKGKGAMPPSGGNAGLTNQQLKAAIEFMME